MSKPEPAPAHLSTQGLMTPPQITAPTEAMLAPIERLARFMATLDTAHLEGVFADDGVTIHENFAPFVFAGAGAVPHWTALFRDHAKPLGELRHSFGPAQDFHLDGTLAHFALPTTWTGQSHGQSFVETGGWSFVLASKNDTWRIKAYAWVVTNYAKT